MKDLSFKKVLFLTNVPSPYRVDFFNELGKYCDLTVVFEKKTSSERHGSWKNYRFDTFKGIFLKGISVRSDAAFCLGITKILKKEKFDEIICTNVSSPTGMIAVNYMKKHGISYCLECDGAVAGNGKGIKEKVKKYFISGARKYYSTSMSSDEYYVTYGAAPKDIIRYPFTSLRESDVERAVATAEEKKALKEKLGIKAEKLAVSVGRFSYRGGYGKGFDTLIKAAHEIDGNENKIYIIGDEPTEEFLDMREALARDNVKFIGHLSKKELREYYRAADVFVLMTRGDAWGLVVNEAMSCGLPVITTDKCVAGLELVEDDVNGYIIGAESWRDCEKYLSMLFNDAELCEKMGKASLEKIKTYTIEEMVQVHLGHMEETI